MITQTAVSETARLRPWRAGVWRWHLPRSRGILAGITDRSGDAESLQRHVTRGRALVLAEQVHGASVAMIETASLQLNPIPGCDGLITRVPGLALVVRTADCLPIAFWDPARQTVGIAHVGWRGLEQRLPMRFISAAHQYYRSHPTDLWVAIGPAIRACCYEVGQEFLSRFNAFVQERNGRLMCDLIGCATDQLVAAGVRRARILDAGECTACEASRWHSVRRDAASAGRLFSFIMRQPSIMR